MNVRMEHTKGRGAEADVWVDGALLTVCDGLSESGKPCRPGVIEDARFRYVTESPPPVEELLAGNPKHEKGLDPVRSWTYVGYGQIVDIMPTVIDFGVVRMECPQWLTDSGVIGQYVRVPVDRLELEAAGPTEDLP